MSTLFCLQQLYKQVRWKLYRLVVTRIIIYYVHWRYLLLCQLNHFQSKFMFWILHRKISWFLNPRFSLCLLYSLSLSRTQYSLFLHLYFFCLSLTLSLPLFLIHNLSLYLFFFISFAHIQYHSQFVCVSFFSSFSSCFPYTFTKQYMHFALEQFNKITNKMRKESKVIILKHK